MNLQIAKAEAGPDGIETFPMPDEPRRVTGPDFSIPPTHHEPEPEPQPPFACKPGSKTVRKFLIQIEIPNDAQLCTCPKCLEDIDRVLREWVLHTSDDALSFFDPISIFPLKVAVSVTTEP